MAIVQWRGGSRSYIMLLIPAMPSTVVEAPSAGRRSLLACMVAGLLASGCGVAICLLSADHLLRLGEGDSLSSEVVASVVGRALLVLTEAVACLLFTGLAGLVLAIRHRDVARVVLVFGALIKTAWLVASVTLNWQLGWYYVFDPQHRGSVFLAAFSLLQAVLWFLAAAR